MNKEQILDHLKYLVRTICYRHTDPNFNISSFVHEVGNVKVLFEYANRLSTGEVDWLEKEFEEWVNTEMIRYKDVINEKFNFEKIMRGGSI